MRGASTVVSTSMPASCPEAVTIILQVTTDAEALDAYSTVVSRVAGTLAPSVANLRVRRGGGSGVVISADGFLLTNAHVVAGRAGRVVASFTDGREVPARVVGTDPLSDLALLRAEGQARLVAMSGSGPTCFAVYDDLRLAQEAGERLRPQLAAAGFEHWCCRLLDHGVRVEETPASAGGA